MLTEKVDGTEFNYLFNEIYACSIGDEQDITAKHFYGFGNNMRKFLESYLYFKYPNDIGLMERIKKFFGEDSISVNLVNRIVQEYSHLAEQFDRGIVPIDVDEMKKVAIIVMERMKEKDPDQFEALCHSVGINTAAIAVSNAVDAPNLN